MAERASKPVLAPSLDPRRVAGFLRAFWMGTAAVTIGIVLVGLALRYPPQRQTCMDSLIECFIAQRLMPSNLAGIGDPQAALQFHAGFFLLYNLLIRGTAWALALLLLWRRPTDVVALAAAFYLLAVGHPGPLLVVAERWPLLAPFATGLRILSGLGFAFFVALFPNGRLVPGWSRWVLLIWLVEALASPFVNFPSGMPLWYVLGVLIPQYGAIVVLHTHRYRRLATLEERLQTKWVLYGALLWFTISLLNRLSIIISPPLDAPITPLFYVQVVAFGLAVIVWPLAITISILRYRLFDIDIILNRTLVYSALTVLVAALYVLLVGGLGMLLQAQGNLALALPATAVVAVLFQPLRDWVQRGVNRLLYGRRAEPYAIIAQLGDRLEAAFAPEDLLPAITQTVSESLRLPYVAIGTDPSDPTHVASATGSPGVVCIDFPLTYQGTPVGHLLASPRRGETGLSPNDRRLLGDLAQQAGAAVHGVRLMGELRDLNTRLQDSRERLVLAREEERRRIRRDLHDDLAPTLAGLALSTDTLADLVATNPQRAEALARTLHEQIRLAAGSIRRLVHDLRPPALDEYGLVAVLRDRAAQLSSGGALAISVDVGPDLPPLPAAVEVAVYRIVQEAMMNVVKHAAARTCRVSLAFDGALHIAVTDDGVGLVDERVPGVGLRSMRERAEELGGTLDLEQPASGGTSIQVRLPVRWEAT